MLAVEYLRNPDAIGRRPIFAVYGEDAYLRRESIGSIIRGTLGRDTDDFAVTRFPGETASLSDVLDEVRTLPFLAKARVAIVEDADPFVTAHRGELETYAQKPSSSGVLVLSVKTWPSNTKLAKIVEKLGVSIQCLAPKDQELPSWLRSLARLKGPVVLEEDAADLLIELVGTNIGLLAGELEKLITYVGDRRKIFRDDVALMVGAGRIQQIWGVIDLATTGKGNKAIEALDSILASGEEPIRILGAFRVTLLKVYHSGQLRRAKMDGREACKMAGITFPKQIETTLKQHAHLGPGRVDRLPETLLRADFDLKGGSQMSPRLILERLMVEWAMPRAD